MVSRFLTALALVLLALAPAARAATQTVLISEFVASNDKGLTDEDGEHPDWLELYNPGASPVNLDGWYLTDNVTKPTKWRIPAVTLAPKGFLVVLCSKKDRSDPTKPLHTNFKLSAGGSYLGLIEPDGVTVSSEYAPAYPAQQTDVSYGMSFKGGSASYIVTGAAAKAIIPINGALGATWRDADFDDTGWKSGTTGVGYERSSGYETLIGLDVGADMYNKNTTAYIRIPFTLDAVPDLTSLTLRMKYDDGFWAYLNGTFLASANTQGTPAWNSNAPGFYDDPLAVQWHDYDISSAIPALRAGKNVLAIHGLNDQKTSSDFLMIPELTGVGNAAVQPQTRTYFVTPTPGAPNADASNQGPLILSATHTPAVPSNGQDLQVTAVAVPSENPTQAVTLNYRVNYGATVSVPMTGNADEEYTATIPASAYAPGDMVRYYISATDTESHASRLPMFLNPTGSPEYQGTMVADPSVETQLPVLYWWVQDVNAAGTDTGTRASLFYLDKFYDNIFVRLRGNTSASWPKKNYKFEFNDGHDFTWDTNEPVVDEMNVQSTYSDKSYMRQVLAWETYEQAGVPGVHAFHLRVQQNGVFHSVAEWVEHPDKNFLGRIGLDDDGALYKMYNDFTSAALGEDWVEKKTRKEEDSSDLQAFIDGVKLSGAALTNYMFDNVNVPEMINYDAATTIIHDNDHIGKNYFVYRDTEGTREWQMLPWDKDLTFGRNFTNQGGVLNDTIWAATDPYSHPLFGDRSYPKVDGPWNKLIDALHREPTIRQMYLRRLRTLMETQLQPPNTPVENRKYEKRIDELVNYIGPDVVLDRARWGNPYGQNQDLSAAVTIMKNAYLAVRRNHLFITHSTPGDKLIPDTQPAAPSIAFGAVQTVPEGGNADEEYITLVNSEATAIDISGWKLGGAASLTFAPGVVIPAGGTLYVSPNVNAFRARATAPKAGMGLFVQGNYTGRVTGSDGALSLTTDAGTLIAVTPYTAADLQRALAVAAGLAEATPQDIARLNVVPDGGAATVDIQDAAALARILNPSAQ